MKARTKNGKLNKNPEIAFETGNNCGICPNNRAQILQTSKRLTPYKFKKGNNLIRL